jgi:tetratricopeptide (TPR) repeat protein
MVKPQNPQG